MVKKASKPGKSTKTRAGQPKTGGVARKRESPTKAREKKTSKADSTRKSAARRATTKLRQVRPDKAATPAKSKNAIAKRSGPRRSSDRMAAENSCANLATSHKSEVSALEVKAAQVVARRVRTRQPSTNNRPISMHAGDIDENPRVVGGLRIFDKEDPLPKSRLSEKSLRQFANLLLAKRRELVGNVEHMSFEALVGHNPVSGRSHMPQHMADIGSDAWEQEFTLGLLENERTLVREIDEALLRIRDGTYGVCQATHRPISRARLIAKPWARYCIEYARLKEQGRVR